LKFDLIMKELVIGIDIGGTFTKYGFVDREGNIYQEGASPTDPYDNVEDYLRNLVGDLKRAEKELPQPFRILGAGIGAPSANYHKGTVEHASNLRWKGIVPFAEMFREYYGVPARLTNDANAAALGEMLYGGAKGMRDFIMITLGTGLGSGIVVNGDLVYGHDGFAGEIGHVNVYPDGRQCGCGGRGCLETYASASGIKRTVFELLASDHMDSELARFSFQELDSKTVYEAALRRDPLALKAFDVTGKILGAKLADAVATTSPQAIFLYGGLAGAGELILAPTKRYMEACMIGLFKNKVRVLPSGLTGKNVAILGAAALIWKDEQQLD
jgi:glucokinase